MNWPGTTLQSNPSSSRTLETWSQWLLIAGGALLVGAWLGTAFVKDRQYERWLYWFGSLAGGAFACGIDDATRKLPMAFIPPARYLVGYQIAPSAPWDTAYRTQSPGTTPTAMPTTPTSDSAKHVPAGDHRYQANVL